MTCPLEKLLRFAPWQVFALAKTLQVASVAYAWRAPNAPYFLPCRPRFLSHRERSGSKPTPSSVGRGRAKHTVAKEKADALHLLFLLASCTDLDVDTKQFDKL